MILYNYKMQLIVRDKAFDIQNVWLRILRLGGQAVMFVFDDCVSGQNIFKDPYIRHIFNHGRHFYNPEWSYRRKM